MSAMRIAVGATLPSSVVLARFPSPAEADGEDVEVSFDLLDESPPERDEETDLAPERTRTDGVPGELFRDLRVESDVHTWARLVELADAAGNEKLAAAFRSAFEDERSSPRLRVPSA